jgi:hypothetical protein
VPDVGALFLCIGCRGGHDSTWRMRWHWVLDDPMSTDSPAEDVTRASSGTPLPV